MKNQDYECPNCKEPIDSDGYWWCRKCEKGITFCQLCEKYSPLTVRKSADSPESYRICCYCGDKKTQTLHVYKSSIYEYYKFAFKFVNRLHVPYPMYFGDGTLPAGKIEADLGDYVNDFAYELIGDESDIFSTDWGTARAYKIKVGDSTSAILLSHETGLEVFLMAAGAFVGLEVAKFALKRTLETIETSINKWWENNSNMHWKNRSGEEIEEGELVVAIQVRTPYWEVTIDGSFDESEKELIFDHLEKMISPSTTVEESFKSIGSKDVKNRILKKSRKVVSHNRSKS